MSQDLIFVSLILALLVSMAPVRAASADDSVLARLRRIGRGEWSARPVHPHARVPYAGPIREAALRHGLHPSLLAGLVRAESAFNPRAVSWAGAQGLGQLMPSTALDLGVENPFDPAENLDGSAHYLSLQVHRFGNVRTALAAYHAGPERARRGALPPETRTYVARVLRFEREYRRRNIP
jgi:soluble lytic murein transglycosylase-like protein